MTTTIEYPKFCIGDKVHHVNALSWIFEVVGISHQINYPNRGPVRKIMVQRLRLQAVNNTAIWKFKDLPDDVEQEWYWDFELEQW